MEELRSRLRQLRSRLGLNQGAFAAKMGVKQNTWSNIEHGANPCSDRYVNLVCLTYNVRKDWLKEGKGEMFETAPEPAPTGKDAGGKSALPPEVADLIEIYKELVPMNQRAVQNFMETTLQAQRNTLKAVGERD